MISPPSTEHSPAPAPELPASPPAPDAPELPAYPPAPELPANPPAQELPPYPPVSELPAYPPAPDLTGYPPAQELPTYPPAPELPPYPPVSELPAYPPAPDLTGYPPAQELPAYPSAPEGQAEAAAAQELPTFPPPPEGQPEASAALSGGDGGPRAAAGAAPVPERGAADGPAGRRAELLCERLLAYARALRLEPGQYLRLVLSVMEEGPTDLAAALDMLKARAGFGGPEGLLRLSSSFPEAAPRIRRSSMASEKF